MTLISIAVVKQIRDKQNGVKLTEVCHFEILFQARFLRSCASQQNYMSELNPLTEPDTDITITTPLPHTQERITCAGVAPSLSAACLMGLSTGPPGTLVIGLLKPARPWFRNASEAAADSFTHVRELYASVTTPNLAENSNREALCA